MFDILKDVSKIFPYSDVEWSIYYQEFNKIISNAIDAINRFSLFRNVSRIPEDLLNCKLDMYGALNYYDLEPVNKRRLLARTMSENREFFSVASLSREIKRVTGVEPFFTSIKDDLTVWDQTDTINQAQQFIFTETNDFVTGLNWFETTYFMTDIFIDLIITPTQQQLDLITTIVEQRQDAGQVIGIIAEGVLLKELNKPTKTFIDYGIFH